MSTPFHDRLTTLQNEVETEIKSMEATLDSLRTLYNSLKAATKPNAFTEHTGLTLVEKEIAAASKPSPEAFYGFPKPVTHPKTTVGIGEAIKTLLAGAGSRGMTFVDLRMALAAKGFGMSKIGTLNGALMGFQKHGKVKKDGNHYVFVSR